MRKIFSLVVLVLFLVSVMSVAIAQQAEDVTSNQVKQNIKAVSAKNIRERIAAADDCECEAVYGPVCGNDGATYANKCRAECAGVDSYEEGRCAIAAAISKVDPALRAKFTKLSRATQTKLASLDKAKIEKELAKIRVKTVNKAEDLKLRVLTRERFERAKNNFLKARERYEKAKGEYLVAREKYRAAKDAGDEEAAIEHAKEVLLNSAEAILSHLEKIKSKIEENEEIGEEEAADLVERIDNQISEIEAIKEKIEAAETAEEIREAARELNAKWRHTKQKANAFAERVVTARVQGVINQLRVLEKKLDIALTAMEEKGIEVDVEVEEFSSLISDAKEKFEQAQEKLEQAREEEEDSIVKSLVDEAKSLIEESKDLLREAHEKLKEIVAKIREAGQELEIDEDAAVEVEEETEEA